MIDFKIKFFTYIFYKDKYLQGLIFFSEDLKDLREGSSLMFSGIWFQSKQKHFNSLNYSSIFLHCWEVVMCIYDMFLGLFQLYMFLITKIFCSLDPRKIKIFAWKGNFSHLINSQDHNKYYFIQTSKKHDIDRSIYRTSGSHLLNSKLCKRCYWIIVTKII